MSDYSASSVVRTRFPNWQRESDGTWSRVWHVTLESPAGEVGREYDFSDERQCVIARVDSEVIVTLRTTTHDDPMSDELFYFAAYRALQAVHDRVGPIATIEGLPRTAYQPFRPRAAP